MRGTLDEDDVAPYDSRPGTKLRYAFPENGYDHDQRKCKTHLRADATYTLASSRIEDCHTWFRLEEVPGVMFNSVMFGLADEP